MKERLLEYAANLSVDILEKEILPDHILILLEVNPPFGIHKAVKSLKGYTSKVLAVGSVKREELCQLQ